ncbi:MAG: TonB-dependent receptor [Methylobacter sp.]|nr:TonB-dependent receptor [Methylobacter sp.]
MKHQIIPRHTGQYRHLLPILALVLASSTEVFADQAAVTLDLPAQSLAATLKSLAKAGNAKLIYSDALVQGLKADALHGEFTVPQALNRLLGKNGLQYEAVGNGVITLKASPKKPAMAQDTSIFELGEMTVSAVDYQDKLTSRDIATSVDVMYADKIADQNVLTAYDLFHRMPGVQITQFGQGTTTGKLSFRAFNGEGNVNAVKLMIDGIPSNTNDGNMPFIDALFPLEIESLEVVRGTNDPRYGLHAIAGSTAINTTTGGNYAKARLSYGSFNSHEIQSGFGNESHGFSQNYAISYRSSDGYRDHSTSNKNGFSGKWFYTPEDNKYKIGLITRWSEADTQEPGYLTYQEQLADPVQSMARNATDGGTRTLGQVSAHLDVNLTNDLFWSSKSYGNLFEDQRFVKFDTQFSQQERNRDEVQYGAITSLTYHPEVNWLDDFSIETGFDFQQQHNKFSRYNTTERIRTRTRNDEHWDFLVYGGYIQAVIKPTKWLKLTPGFRADQVGGYFNNINSGASAPVNDYGTISQPKIGAVITPIKGYSLYGNWGRSFQVGLGSGTFKTVTGQANVRPSINEGWEVGIKLKPVDWTEGRVAYWVQDAVNEFSRNLADNTLTNIGATKRQGVDVQVKVSPIEPLSIWSTFSLQEAIVKTSAPDTTYAVNNEIVNTPNYLFSAGIDYQITPALRSSLWTSGQGNYYVDQANARGKYGEYALLNLDLEYQVSKEVDIQFQVKNLADTQREYVWYDNAYIAPLFSPGDGRAFYGSINVKFDY